MYGRRCRGCVFGVAEHLWKKRRQPTTVAAVDAFFSVLGHDFTCFCGQGRDQVSALEPREGEPRQPNKVFLGNGFWVIHSMDTLTAITPEQILMVSPHPQKFCHRRPGGRSKKCEEAQARSNPPNSWNMDLG